ncbi:uncharacterized protein LOC111301896 [Durio zibethinus]|uniref:Uncharacterized protein LOC111301896 n=1 Tax=Durio zibethinus TaxID=66656 RepID=A0A6P5ZLD6_DURZI|nr:uncharacterized protein LOC111301896 [Durio zibethinus]
MGRQSDPAVHSSIALLRERFRQLQRAKEMRQEREVLRLLSEAERINPAIPHEASQLFFHSELILQPRPPLQGSLSSEPSMRNMHTQRQVIETPSLSNLRPRDTVMHTSTLNDSDVDTTLHLCKKFGKGKGGCSGEMRENK